MNITRFSFILFLSVILSCKETIKITGKAPIKYYLLQTNSKFVKISISLMSRIRKQKLVEIVVENNASKNDLKKLCKYFYKKYNSKYRYANQIFIKIDYRNDEWHIEKNGKLYIWGDFYRKGEPVPKTIPKLACSLFLDRIRRQNYIIWQDNKKEMLK